MSVFDMGKNMKPLTMQNLIQAPERTYTQSEVNEKVAQAWEEAASMVRCMYDAAQVADVATEMHARAAAERRSTR